MARRPKKARRRRGADSSIGKISVARRGYAFVETPEGTYFIMRSRLGGAMSGDTVEVVRLRSLERQREKDARRYGTAQGAGGEPSAHSSAKEMLGSVLRVLERSQQRVVGRLVVRGGLGAVIPLDERMPYDVFIDSSLPGLSAEDGDVVVVQINTYPSKHTACSGYVVEVIGREGDQSLGIDAIIRKHGLETAFSAAALEQAEEIASLSKDAADGVAAAGTDASAGAAAAGAAGTDAAGGVAAARTDAAAGAAAVWDKSLSKNSQTRHPEFAASPEFAVGKAQDQDLSFLSTAAGRGVAADRGTAHAGMGTAHADRGTVHLSACNRRTDEPSPCPQPPSLPPALPPALQRRDLCGREVFTIDPADAKDCDDALSIEFSEGQMRLGVHIADVSVFVPWDSPIDLAARRRGTSVYLPDRVIPMLPPALSDDVCSLKPREVRLAMTIDLLLRPDSSVEGIEVYPSAICSREQLSYDEVLPLLTGEGDASSAAAALASPLRSLDRLAQKLAKRRVRRGSLDFEAPETRLRLSADGTPVGVFLRRKNRATSLVEECMILANEAVAGIMLGAEAAMVYRIHEEPLPASLEAVWPLLKDLGYVQHAMPQSSAEIQALLDASQGRPEHQLVCSLMLRAMSRARYHTAFTTHFGLASKAYTHFTSPIRRYPDLMAHRLLRCHLAGEEPPASMLANLALVCKQSSEAEVGAEAATQEAVRLKLCEYLEGRVGERFRGFICAANSYGFYVREDTMCADGFVASESLKGQFAYDSALQRWSEPATGKEYRLGQAVTVELVSASPAKAEIDFVIV